MPFVFCSYNLGVNYFCTYHQIYRAVVRTDAILLEIIQPVFLTGDRNFFWLMGIGSDKAFCIINCDFACVSLRTFFSFTVYTISLPALYLFLPIGLRLRQCTIHQFYKFQCTAKRYFCFCIGPAEPALPAGSLPEEHFYFESGDCFLIWSWQQLFCNTGPLRGFGLLSKSAAAD